MKYLTAAWDFLNDGVDWLAEKIEDHPRKVAIALVLYAAYWLSVLVF
jgi:hypothetical protein